MNTGPDPYADRKELTFEQAGGVEPLPTQLVVLRQVRAGSAVGRSRPIAGVAPVSSGI